MAAAIGAVVAFTLVSSAAPVVPVPSPIVMVHTESGGVVRDTPVPIGGVPVPIDVDNGSLLGLLSPDIDVSVGLVSVPELPNVLVPNIVVKRDTLAVLRHAPAPPLKLNARVIINDVGSLERLATVDYGFETPPGERIPPLVVAKLVGPVQTGFVDPLTAKIETPGYSGALKFNIKATTSSFEGTFGLSFDPLPEKIEITEDPRDDGLDFTYDHSGPTPDVHLQATADLKDLGSGRVRHIGASVERLPNHIALSNTSTHDRTLVEYRSGSDLGKPDLEADYRDTLSDGTIVADVNAKISGLPAHMKGTIDTREGADDSTDIDGVKFEVLGGGEIGAVDFVARNFLGDPGNVPEHEIGPEQFVSLATRRQEDGDSRYRAAGRLLAVRGGEFKRTGPKRDKLDVTTDVGDGTKPLRGILDMDDRGPDAGDDAKRLFVDSTVTPLPSSIHVLYEPPTEGDPQHLVYESSSTVDVDTNTVIATGAADGCGQDRVVCAQARIDKLPPHMDVKLPGEGGTDFSISHDGGVSSHPDVSATVDVGPDTTKDPPSTRVWARASLLRIPNEVRGRMDTRGGELRAAEFHGCAFNYDSGACTTPIAAIGRVRFTVRDQPSRAGLPPRPDTATQFVTLVSRHRAPAAKRFEVAGRVDEVRNVVFHQLDLAQGDGKTDGVLGALVDVGTGGDPFDVVIDDLDDALAEAANPDDPPVVVGEAKKDITVKVADLPQRFTACVRSPKEEAPPNPSDLPDDELLAPCETTNVVTPDTGEHAVTPLTAHYTATNADGQPDLTKVAAYVKTTEPDLDDLDASDAPIPATQVLDLSLDKVPGFVRADVIPPITPDARAVPPVAGRKLKVAYDASQKIDRIDFALESRRASSICEDPRPKRKALCLNGTLKDLPSKLTALYDPDDAKGDIDLLAAPPTGSNARLSILPLHLSKVSPEEGSSPLVLDASIEEITEHVAAKVQSLELDGENPPDNPTLPQQLATCGDTSDNDGDDKIDASDDDCDKDPARLSFDACPDAGSACAGIGKITFTATNALVGDPLPPVPAANPPVAGLDQEFSFVQSGEDFRARGVVRNFKRLSYSKLDQAGAPSRVTRLGSAFGNGSPLRAFVDRDTGKETQKLEAIITDAPQTVDLCLRDETNVADLKADGGDFCEKRDADGDERTDEGKLALQAAASGDVKPDIHVRSFETSKGGGAEVAAGSVKIDDLAERIDALVAKGGDTEVLVEGHDLGDDEDAAPKNVASRVTFDFRNFRRTTGLVGFPWQPLDGGTDPKHDARNDDAGGRNYIQLFKNNDGRLMAEGSLPEIKQVQVEPRPCNDDGARFPTSGFAPDQRPDYKCVRATAAKDRPLGLAVRTIQGFPAAIDTPATDDVLSLEEGRISAMPDSLAATIAKAPDKLKLFPLCGADQPAPCRPPMISVEAPNAEGDAGTLEARLATGPTNLITGLRETAPDDPMSASLNYEERPRDYTARGARVKVGSTDNGDSALRMGVNIKVPKFLDLDPPTLYDCAHVNENPGAACDAKGVGKAFNRGYESKDIGFRLVAADDKHLGNPPADDPYLGRVALLVAPLFPQTAKQQIVLTGMPAPDDRDPIIKTRTIIGGSSKGLEDFPDLDDISTKGFEAPAHLDAQVFLRNDYNAEEDGRNQLSYAQIDGRVNAPLSMAMRLIDRPPPPVSVAGFEFHHLQSSNRANVAVPSTQLTLRNAPSSNNQDAYDDPTFRIRSSLRKGFQSDEETSIGGHLKNFFICDKDGIGIGVPALAQICVVLPKHVNTKYIDVQLNADPHSTGWTTANAARTIDAVAGPFGGENDAELRGWKDVNGTGGDFGKGAPALITPLATLRLTNFQLGLRASAGVGLAGLTATYEMVGDLLLGLAGHTADRTRLGHNNTQVEIASTGGHSRLMADMQAMAHLKVTLDVFFGAGSVTLLNAGFGPFDNTVNFNRCTGGSGPNPTGPPYADNEFWTGADTLEGPITPAPGARHAGIDMSLASLGGLSIEVLNLLSQMFPACWYSTSTSAMVTDQAPAPSYTVVDHPVPDRPESENTSTSPPGPAPSPTLPNLLVPGGAPTKVLCGSYAFDRVIVAGHVVAGAPGQTDANGRACNGHLTLQAREVTITPSGDIKADAIISGGPGTPGPGSGSGGGAGHHAMGGQSGRNKAGFVGPGGLPYDEPAAGPSADFGSEGRLGTGAAGKGGGTLVITASEIFDNDGEISARGGNGGNAPLTSPSLCRTGGGGGSGGAISVAANIITGGGTIDVGGGDGGDGGWGGGGGSGGRITAFTVANDNTFVFDGGEGAGTDSGFCQPGPDTNPHRSGDPGGDGPDPNDPTDGLGLHPDRVTNAALSEAFNPGPFTNEEPRIDLTEIDSKSGGPVEIILCHRRVPFGPNAFSDPALDPPGVADLDEFKDGATCNVRVAVDPTANQDNTYLKTVQPELEEDGVYGFVAYSQRPRCLIGTYNRSTFMCHTGTSLISPSYDVQDLLSPKATAKIGVDRGAPAASPQAVNGSGTCIESSLCLTETTGELDAGASDNAGGSGVDTVECRVSNSAGVGPFGDCEANPTSLGLAPGLNTVDVRVRDRAGNQVPFDGAVKWFVDTTAPSKPVVTVSHNDAAVNGWHHATPNVSVNVGDPVPSSGFGDDAITLHIDEGKVTCGVATFASFTDCSDQVIAALQPPIDFEGLHTLTATATDRTGLASPASDPKTTKVDTRAPMSRFFIGPKLPDGGPARPPVASNWYLTQPFIGFSAKDVAGGSGVDPQVSPSGIFYAVDGGPSGNWTPGPVADGGDFRRFDPEEDSRLADGVHDVCWYAVDVAGNAEVARDPHGTAPTTNCRLDIKVDTTPPVVSDPIDPPSPGGNNSYYLARPTVTPSATDPAGAAAASERSGVDKVQYQVDDGPWTTAAPVQMPEGEHEIRVRAFDVAGNAAALTERTVRVDLSKPTAALGAYPPSANGQGWLRQPRTDSVAVRDGRDSSGADGATYKIDAGGEISYLRPFTVEPGVHTATVRPRDRAGLVGTALAQSSKIDVTAPVATPSSSAPAPILISILGLFGTTTLNYTVTDDLAPRVKVNVLIYDTLGTLVRRIPISGPHPGGFSSVGAGSVVWNGHNDANKGVLPGTYHFRVQAIDQAGNSVMSTESPVFLVIQGILPI